MHRLLQLLKSAPLTLLTALMALVAFQFAPVSDQLALQLPPAGSIGPLRLIGCHLLHWSPEHLLWDLGMFVLLGVICERQLRCAYYAVVATAAVAIPLAVMLMHPDIESYRGLSGIDTAVFSLLVLSTLLDRLRERDHWQSAMLAALVVGMLVKIAIEFASGEVLFVSQANFAPLPISHLVGAILGGVAAIASQTIWGNYGMMRTRMQLGRCASR